MAGIFSLRNWVMKQLKKPDKSGIMKIPPKGKVDFGEMLLREQLFQKGIDPKMIKNEKQLDNIINTPAVPKSERVKPKKSGKVIEVDFDKGRWNKAQGGRTGLSYLLAEDTNERMPLEKGGASTQEELNQYLKDREKRDREEKRKKFEKDFEDWKKWQDTQGGTMDFAAEGGRIGYAAGGMGRRAFLKLMAALGLTGAAAKSGLVSLLGKGGKKQIAKEVITTPNVAGKPAWFDPLVTRIINEGEDVTKQFAYKERMRVHTKPISETEEVTIYRDLDDGSVRVNYGQKLKIDDTKPYEKGNIGRASNDPDQIDLIVRKGEEVEPDLKTGKGGGKTKASFEASEAEPRAVGGPEDADIEFDGIREVENVDDLMQDVSVLEEFATGKKLTGKKAAKAKKKKEDFQKFTEDNQAQAEYLENKYGPYDDSAMDDLADDFASGGIARMLGE